jgi:DNA replication protein DnaC
LFPLTQVRAENELWDIARSRFEAGDELLWETLGKDKNVEKTLMKILRGWFQSKASFGTLKTTSEYPLEAFNVPCEVQKWISTGTYKKKTLILCGDGELGKTAMALAIMLSLASAVHFISKEDQAKSLVFLSAEGLIWDEACL